MARRQGEGTLQCNDVVQVVLTKSSGEMAKRLRAENIQVKVVEDLAVGVEMHNVDCVLLGAEGVVETGGELCVVIRG